MIHQRLALLLLVSVFLLAYAQTHPRPQVQHA
jgi:hypothetical protein